MADVIEIRLRCLEAAVRVAGSVPNSVAPAAIHVDLRLFGQP